MTDILGKPDKPRALALESWQELVAPPGPSTLAGPHQIQDFTQKLLDYEALQGEGEPLPIVDLPGVYSLQWFLRLENQRHHRQGRWIPNLLEFAKHAGDTLLALGNGLGTDWVQYARHGAHVVVCGGTPGQLEMIRRNFQVRGLAGRFLLTDPARLPLENASVDVACVTSLPGPEKTVAAVAEVFRVLKPGGKVLAVVPARFHVDYWFHAAFFWYRWFFGPETGRDIPGEKFSGRQLRRLFNGFTDHRIRKRQLRRREVPALWRILPLPLLARLMGRFLVLKAFKPLK